LIAESYKGYVEASDRQGRSGAIFFVGLPLVEQPRSVSKYGNE
jgi:hypothetical protein